MSVFEIILLVITTLSAISILWSTLRLGISPMPSSAQARQVMLQLTDETGEGAIYELGSGWGGILVSLSKKYPHRQIVGYEYSFFPWLTTFITIKVLGLKNVRLYRKNFLYQNLTAASVVLCYLVPEVMQKLESKLRDESGSLEYVISNNFSLPLHQPIKTIPLNDLYKSPIYLYKVK